MYHDDFCISVLEDGALILELEEPYDEDAATYSTYLTTIDALALARQIAENQGFELIPTVTALRAGEV